MRCTGWVGLVADKKNVGSSPKPVEMPVCNYFFPSYYLYLKMWLFLSCHYVLRPYSSFTQIKLLWIELYEFEKSFQSWGYVGLFLKEKIGHSARCAKFLGQQFQNFTFYCFFFAWRKEMLADALKWGINLLGGKHMRKNWHVTSP